MSFILKFHNFIILNIFRISRFNKFTNIIKRRNMLETKRLCWLKFWIFVHFFTNYILRFESSYWDEIFNPVRVKLMRWISETSNHSLCQFVELPKKMYFFQSAKVKIKFSLWTSNNQNFRFSCFEVSEIQCINSTLGGLNISLSIVLEWKHTCIHY